VIRWDADGPYAVAFSTRAGGVSEGPFASLNLGRATADEPDRVDENRRRLLAEVGGDVERLALNWQTHSATVRRAAAGDRGNHADGLWTDEPALPVMALTADCLPIALARTNGEAPAVAVLHAGWRGLLAGVVGAGVEALGGAPAAAIGPGIGPCCYEVGDEVAQPFAARFGADVLRGRRLDLWTAAERSLRDAGVTRIERVDLCSACNPELFFSHRRDEGLTGRQGVVALVA
jgi:purine-nucleoside/S-methyl-5'-thioadenosine phosphorylase / adenosine deaminase